jgi:hypothetical protein
MHFIRKPALTFKVILEQSMSLWQVTMKMLDESSVQCQALLADNEELLTQLEHLAFDVVVIDGTSMSRCYYLMPLRLGVTKWISYTDVVPWNLIRTPWLPSFVPPNILTTLTDRMSFVERLHNAVQQLMLHGVEVHMARAADNTTLHDLYRSRYGHFDSLNSS